MPGAGHVRCARRLVKGNSVSWGLPTLEQLDQGAEAGSRAAPGSTADTPVAVTSAVTQADSRTREDRG